MSYFVVKITLLSEKVMLLKSTGHNALCISTATSGCYTKCTKELQCTAVAQWAILTKRPMSFETQWLRRAETKAWDEARGFQG